MLYTVVARGFIAGDAGPGLAWPLLGVLPLFVFGMWLLTASTARSALFIAWAATAMAVGAGFETFLQMNPDVIREPWYPLVNLVGLMAATVASAAFISMFATFPTGIPERRWQRISVGFFWVPVVVAPFSLLVVPHVLTPEVHAESGEGIPNPFALPALAGAEPVVEWIVYSWPAVFLALAVLISRAFFGDPEVRVRTRLMAWLSFATVLTYSISLFVPENGIANTVLLVALAAIPVVAIHGILRHGAFDVAAEDRARFVTRSSNVLITVLYGIAVVAPAVLLVGGIPPLGIALLTGLVAVALLPVRGGCSGGSTASSSAIGTGSSRCSASSAPSSNARASRATSWPTWRPRWPTDSALRGCASAWRGRTANSPPRRRESRETPSVRRPRPSTSSTPTRSWAASRWDRAIAGSTATTNGRSSARSPARPRHPSPTCASPRGSRSSSPS